MIALKNIISKIPIRIKNGESFNIFFLNNKTNFYNLQFFNSFFETIIIKIKFIANK